MSRSTHGQDAIQPPQMDVASTEELELARRYAPRLLFDDNEPFLPIAIGFTVFHADAYSPSFPRCIGLTPRGRSPAAFAIEYAIWWDWDITHLYELEHVWTFVDEQQHVCRAEASWHGDFQTLTGWNDRLQLHKGTHPVAFSQPGKHAFAGNPQVFLIMGEYAQRQCLEEAGSGGVLVTSIFEEALSTVKSEANDVLAAEFLKSRAFEPAFQWNQTYDTWTNCLVPWPQLEQWIPRRVSTILRQLHGESID